MPSISIDYVFNRIYDALLWIKYVAIFVIGRKDPGAYISEHSDRTWDGLRDRGWFDSYLAQKDAVVPIAQPESPLWQKILELFGVNLRDSDGDGIPDINDSSPYDSSNLTSAQLKERYQEDFTFIDHVRDLFGLSPTDTDGDGVPDSYEVAHNLSPNNPDTDGDGLPDGEEIRLGTDPRNNDTDGDRVIDGRDEAPLDSNLSSKGIDTDGDGVSDAVEKLIGSDINKQDTDGDGIFDGVDSYPVDINNNSSIPSIDTTGITSNIHFSIQNPVLALLSDLLSIATIGILLILVYASTKWFITFLRSLLHYEHHFHSNDNSHGYHSISHNDFKSHSHSVDVGIPGLAVHTETPSLPPRLEEFDEHPRYAIIKGYMSSESEALWRIGIMEADNMLLDVLKEKGYQGERVGDMLTGASFKTIDLAWDAHKMRNRIAHEGSNFVLSEKDAKRTFVLYETVFRELRAIK